MVHRDVQLARDDYEPLRRVHITNPMDWAQCLGTDFWIRGGASTGPLASLQGELLSEHGWTTTSLSGADGSAADLMTASDKGTPGEFTQNAQNDLIKSPAIFGDFTHAYSAALMLGKKKMPRYLIMDAVARFSAVTGTAATTALGFVEDTGSIVVSADSAGTFVSDGTNFVFNMNGSAATSTTTVAADTAVHLWRIVLDRGSGTYSNTAARAYPYIDGTLLVSGGVAVTQDEFPVAFGAGSGDVTNLVQLNMAHIYYAYRVPQFWAGD